ncbi:MAG TPA: S9 family peptidase [Ideonella sp.]|uniref:S9 family peptidase n=1 Tax=Ideonella sp. TaxID=1929293 RepID=UPI002BEC0BA2|nr:S9 family peptidase [Ideonella sp.]HSI49642.1 S9 family peptidase [Ideonella sp.]
MPFHAKTALPLLAPALLTGLLATASLRTWAAEAPAVTPAPQFPLRDFFASPPQGFFRISDGGRWLSWMQPAVGDGGPTPRRNLFVQALDGSKPTGQPRQLTRESARDIANYFWKGDGTLLFQKDFGGDENFHVVAVDALTGQVRDLSPYEGARAEIIDTLDEDADNILLQHNKRDKQVMDVYRVNVKTGAETLVARNPGNIVAWLPDHAGKLRVAVASDGVNNQLLYRATEADEFKTLIATDFRTEVSPQFFDFDNQGLYLLSNRGRDRKALVKLDPAKPDAETVVYEHPAVDLSGASYSRLRKVLTVAEFTEDKQGRHSFDAATTQLYAKLAEKLPGYELMLQASTLAEDKFVVAAASDRTPGTRYLYDAKADTLSKLADINPKLPEAQMATMQPVRYRARDGLEIPAYLTLPVGRAPKNLACVINPHGGPWARDQWGFNQEVQFLANRGYCVLQMNFRGSTGFGRKFWEASFGQWGLAMQDDVSDGVAWLVSQGIADPRRVGLYGGSYGGYATLAGVTFTPKLYAAAVDYVGVSNLFTFMKTIPPYWEPFRQQMYAMVGNPDDPKDNARLAATSPALHVDRIQTPLLIAQGAKDPRVNKAESDQVVEALKKRGVTVQYLVKDNEGHGFHNEENQFEFYGAMESFFGQHLKP